MCEKSLGSSDLSSDMHMHCFPACLHACLEQCMSGLFHDWCKSCGWGLSVSQSVGVEGSIWVKCASMGFHCQTTNTKWPKLALDCSNSMALQVMFIMGCGATVTISCAFGTTWRTLKNIKLKWKQAVQHWQPLLGLAGKSNMQCALQLPLKQKEMVAWWGSDSYIYGHCRCKQEAPFNNQPTKLSPRHATQRQWFIAKPCKCKSDWATASWLFPKEEDKHSVACKPTGEEQNAQSQS